jgi:hypothetical protein
VYRKQQTIFREINIKEMFQEDRLGWKQLCKVTTCKNGNITDDDSSSVTSLQLLTFLYMDNLTN